MGIGSLHVIVVTFYVIYRIFGVKKIIIVSDFYEVQRNVFFLYTFFKHISFSWSSRSLHNDLSYIYDELLTKLICSRSKLFVKCAELYAASLTNDLRLPRGLFVSEKNQH